MSTTKNVALFIFACCFVAPAATSSCYYPNGTVADGASSNPVPCVDTDSSDSFSACCGSEDECFTNGLCKGPGMLSPTAYWRDTCTDPTWQSDDCPKFCYNDSTSAVASMYNQFVLQCSAEIYCCATQTMTQELNDTYCCNIPTAVFSLSPPVRLSGSVYETPSYSQTISASSTTTPSTSRTSTTPTAHVSTTQSSDATTAQPTAASTESDTDSDTSLSTGSKAGIGVGVVLGVSVIAIGTFFVIRRQRTKRRSTDMKTSTESPVNNASSHDHQYKPPLGLSSESAVPEMSDGAAKYELLGAREPVEVEGHREPVEAAGHREPVELGGHTYWDRI